MTHQDPSTTQRSGPPDIQRELEGTGLCDPREIGRGGFGAVYQCRQQALRRDVAVKILLTQDLGPEEIGRFLREQQAMGALSGHPHIVQVLEVGTTRSGRPYLVMPYHARGSLENLIRSDGRLSLDTALRMTIKLAGALETAHRARILHRDIKPGNILLTDYGEPQLTDFGIARIEGGFETTGSVITGSPAFTAPELLRSGGPSFASDIYGLGATLFCMITGHAAYERRSGEQIVAQFLRIAAEPLPDLRPEGIPEDVCNILEATMSHQASDRPATAAAFGELLRDIQRNHAMPAQDMTLLARDDSSLSTTTEPERPLLVAGRSLSSHRTPAPPTPETKFRPSVSVRKLVHRSRLIEALRATPRARLTVIHAPAGFGKSTLAAQWGQQLAQEEAVAVAWLNADRDDNNVVWFLVRLVEAIGRVQPNLTPGLGGLLEEQGEGATRFVLTKLVNDIHTQHKRVAVIIDDWDRVTDPAAVAALRFLLENGCHHLQIIVTSRSSEALPLATLRVRNELVEIDSTALCFDSDEATQFLVDLGGLPLSASEITRLRDSTEGWVAALHLASLSLRGASDASKLIDHLSGRHRAIAEYLAENVIDKVAPDQLEALLAIALPDRICGDLADALTGSSQGQELLERIEKQNLFLRRIDPDGEWFCFHHLFAQFLRQRLARERPEQLSRLHRVAASWLADHQMLSEAVDHALACDEDYAVHIVETHAADCVATTNFATLLGLAAKLPPSLVADRPHLRIALGWTHVLLRQPTGLYALDGSGAVFADPDLTAEAALIRCIERVMGDHYDDVDTVVQDCLTRSDTMSAWALSAVGIVAALQALDRFEFERVRGWEKWVSPYQHETGGSFTSAAWLCLVGLAARDQLDIEGAERNFRLAREVAIESSGKLSYPARLAGCLLGGLLYERGQLDTAELLLDEVFELGVATGPVDLMVATYATGARIKALRNDPASAAQRLRVGARIAQTFALERLAAHITNERVRLGHMTTFATEDEPEYHRESATATLTAELHEDSIIRSLLREPTPSHITTASARSIEMRRSIDAIRRPRAALHAQLLHVGCLAAAGKTDDAKNELATAIAICADAGLPRVLRDGGPWITPLVRDLEQDRREGQWRDTWPDIPHGFLIELLDD